MDWLKENDYIPKWLGLFIPFFIYYLQRRSQKEKSARGEPVRDIDWLGILFSFFAAISFSVILSPSADSGVRTAAYMIFFLSFFTLIRRYPS